MNHVWIPEGYRSCLGLYDTQKAIGLIKNLFQQKLCLALHLKRVTAPLFVEPSSGLNDDLNGVERPVGFDIPAVGGEGAQVVHSLAKWKRMALYRYDFHPGNGLLTDMNAIRRDEELDNLHSIYADQWDWEKVILPEERTLDYLKDTVRKIVGVICNTLEELQYYFPQLPGGLPRHYLCDDAGARGPLAPPDPEGARGRAPRRVQNRLCDADRRTPALRRAA